jgi:hypothetical protein
LNVINTSFPTIPVLSVSAGASKQPADRQPQHEREADGERHRLFLGGRGELISPGWLTRAGCLALAVYSSRRLSGVLGGRDAALGLGLDICLFSKRLDGVAELLAGLLDSGTDLFGRFRLMA